MELYWELGPALRDREASTWAIVCSKGLDVSCAAAGGWGVFLHNRNVEVKFDSLKRSEKRRVRFIGVG